MKKTQWFLLMVGSFLLVLLTACATQKFTYGKYANADSSMVLNLQADGQFTVARLPSGFVTDQGTFTVNSTELTFLTSAECHPNDVAYYEWSAKGAKMSFRLASYDSCSQRKGLMDGVSWTLMK